MLGLKGLTLSLVDLKRFQLVWSFVIESLLFVGGKEQKV